MLRALFEKTGTAVYISHLDLMRLFQRAFQRAGLHLHHSQGFNQRPTVSIALPMSLGVQSVCELLDFSLEGDALPPEEIAARLNRCLVSGVRILRVYEGGRKIRELSMLDCRVTMVYDHGVPDGTVEEIAALFRRNTLPVEKKGKNRTVLQDIVPMIKRLHVTPVDPNTLRLEARICCQEPALNPAQLVRAIETYLPACAPDFSRYERLEIYDAKEEIFR